MKFAVIELSFRFWVQETLPELIANNGLGGSSAGEDGSCLRRMSAKVS
jgi:hypothetical protein